MNDIINKFLLTGDKFMPEMYLRQPGFVYSACGPFTKHKEKINKFMKTGDTRYIYRSKLDKAYFQHDAAYSESNDFAKRTASDRILRDKAFNIANNPRYNGYERGLASMVYKFLDKKSVSKMGGDLHRSPLIDFDKSGKISKTLSYPLVDLFSRYAFVIPLKSKTGSAVVDAFKEILNKTERKPNKMWVDQGKEFYNKNMKKWLVDNGIDIYSTYNEGKSVIAERFIRTLKNKLYKHMTAVSSDVYYDVLDDIVDKYNNTYHNSIKKKPVDVTNNDYEGYVYGFDEKNHCLKLVIKLEFQNIKTFLQKVTLQIGLKMCLLCVTYKVLCLERMKLLILTVMILLVLSMKKNFKARVRVLKNLN